MGDPKHPLSQRTWELRYKNLVREFELAEALANDSEGFGIDNGRTPAVNYPIFHQVSF